MNNFTLQVTGEDLSVMDKALMALPFGEVAPLVFKIREQIQSQNIQDKSDRNHKEERS